MEIEPEQAYRRAMGAFATGVTVVAADAPRGVSGITVNSLTSVSLKPRLLLWCLGDESARYEVFAHAEDWGVTVLSANERALALRFARAETEGVAPEEAEAFGAAPILKAGIAWFACRTRERRKAGDHLIIIGEVLDFRVKRGAALTFYRGLYGHLGDPREET
ncbi:MAG: flavin reductase [Proteobacteria bacterium]|nr:flavin reductase [Pseudomonadota bacterium]